MGFNEKNHTLINRLTICVIIFIAILYIYTSDKNKLELKMNKKLKELKIQNDILNTKIDSLKLEVENYNRMKLSKISNVNIPKSFSLEKIKVLIDACDEYNFPLKVACRLIYAESSFKEKAVSYKGAKGYMQIMPNTIKHIKNTTKISKDDPHWNIKMGVYYLSHLYNMFKLYDKHTRLRLTILSYNIGPGRVKSDPMGLLNEYFDYPYLNKILGNARLGNI